MDKKIAIGVIAGVVIGVLLSTVVVVLAGDPAGPSTVPGNTESYTLADIYHSLDSGAAATPRAFTEPSTGPGTGTMFTLNEIYTLTRQRAPVRRTGQTTCWNSSGTTIDCAGTGQDGEYQRGVGWPIPRFIDNGDGTVTDNLTGLIWLKNADCPNTARDWSTALSDVAQLNTDGTMNSNDCGDTSNGGSHQTDWRLPNILELESLVDYEENAPPLPSDHPFTSVVNNSLYWSSTSVQGYPSYAELVFMGAGAILSQHDKASEFYVWPVRGGQ